jgi:DHA1 family bicyclomycin/chloramphenicol resistance-like MFS transporter
MLESALPGQSVRARLGMRESVALMAALMALNALAIDMMLPALPAIARGLGVTHPNDQQYVIIAYTIGFGAGQMVWGPLADRFGRRPLLVVGLILYALLAIGCAVAPTFALLLAGRAAMGAAAAATRVLVTAMVRDMFEGEAMARVMSLVFMVFMVVPVLAPSIGQAVLTVAPWQAIFGLLAGYAVIVLGWSLLRLPETLHPEDRRSLRPGAILEATRIVFTDRLAVGYTLASTALFGGLMAYIASIQQIVADAFHQPTRVPLVFAACAAPMAGAAFANSRIVGRFGLRQVGHAGLAAFLLVSAIHWGAAQGGSESLFLFVTLQGLAMIAFAFCSSNFSTLAMTNMEAIAGTASSVLGVTSSVGGALIGLTIGQSFNGTAVPFLMGMLLCGLGALTVVALTERGRLFEKLAIAAQS